MRTCLIIALISAMFGVTGFAQSATEAAAAAAGSAIGGVAGKGVSAGIDKILGKGGQQLKSAAKPGSPRQDPAQIPMPSSSQSKEPLLRLGPARTQTQSNEPLRPSPGRSASVAAFSSSSPQGDVPRRLPPLAELPAAIAVPDEEPPLAAAAPPSPPAMTRDVLVSIQEGTAREELLRAGTPASRVTMFESGHIVEIYRYQARDTVLGVVRLNDGAVSKVEVKP